MLIPSLFLLAVGCGSKSVVSGKVFYKGKQVTKGTVSFFPEGKGGDFSSPIGSDGTYTIKKLPTGPVKIAVNATGPAKPPRDPMMERSGKSGKMFEEMGKTPKDAPPLPGSHNPYEKDANAVAVPAHFADPSTSDLTYEVKSGTQEFDIKIP
jgi:hypothetical protein